MNFSSSITFDYQFPNRLTLDQIEDLKRNISYEEIKRAVWDCGISISPGPDGFTFEFYRKYWSLIDHDVVAAVTSFFSTGLFPPGCNSLFITLIPKSQEAKMVKEFCPGPNLVEDPCKMKDINALSNLFIILANKGFENVKLFYLGGQWVLLELDLVTSKEKITNHMGVGSWFEVLKPACNYFMCEERLVWVAIEGLPVKALTRNTYAKIVASWGKLVDINESDNCSLSCIRVNLKPSCNTVISEDPLGIYKILKRNKDVNVTEGDTHTPQYPPGFTPSVEENVVDNIPENASQPKPNTTTSSNKEKASSVNDKFQASGSILKVMDELIKDHTERSMLWDFIQHLIDSWDGECVLLDGDWIVEPSLVKNEFLKHFATRFAAPSSSSITFDYQFPNRLTPDQIEDLKRNVSYEEIKKAVWDCGISKSPGPDGFTFEFYRKYWSLIDHDVVAAVTSFFSTCSFPPGFGFKDVLTLLWDLFLSMIDESLNLSHLFYADDVIFVGKWNSSNLSTIVNVLKWFYLASGLKINLNKSKLMGVGNSHDVVASAAKSIGCSILHTPFNYLGVKVGGIMSRLRSCDDAIAKLSARLSKWKLKSLSIGGRLTLIKSVLRSLPLYYISSFKVHKGVLSKMESIHQIFFNGVKNAKKKMSLIGWNKILASKKNGGLGVSSVFAYNRALLFKWIWRFLANGASLWSRFISAIYSICGALDNSSSYSRRSPWLDIVHEVRKLASKGIDLLSLVKKKVGNGKATSFWNDVWLGDFPLKQTYPRLYFLELDKHVSVVSKLRANSLISSFRRSPRSGIEEEQLLLLISNTSFVILPNISDRWSWLLDPSGDFSVKLTREFINDSMLLKTDVPTRWVKSIPIKINIFASRVSLQLCSVPLPITKEAILRLNNGLVTFEQARALFNVDLSTFKARLVQLNIFVSNEVNGPASSGCYKLTYYLPPNRDVWVKTDRDCHFAVEFSKERGYLVYLDLEICPSVTIVIKERPKCNVVQATEPFETVKSMIEVDLSLSSGCYKLTYNLPPNGDVWVKTDHDWHFVVQFSKERGYFVYLDLEICPSGTTTHLAYEDASEEEMMLIKLLVKCGRDVSKGKCAGMKGKKPNPKPSVEEPKVGESSKKGEKGVYSEKADKVELLTAMGRNANNQMFPIAWAVVSVENKNNWCWFLSLLHEDLSLGRGSGLTIISDAHKGLIEAVSSWFPNAEHRQCTRHIYANFKRKWSGLQYKRLFWIAVATSVEQVFLQKMEEIKLLDVAAFNWLVERNPNSWSRTYFEMDRCTTTFENGISESFNSRILVRGHNHTLSQKTVGALENKAKILVGFPKCLSRGAAYTHMKMEPELGVSQFYSKNKWLEAYQHSIRPVPGSKLWKPVDFPKPLPPIERKMPRRPRKVRIRHPTENNHEISRRRRVMHCHKSWEVG
ncbi:RNA-directed DNA polymerase, eukaryota, reverse transcriptase zinc-binding domain protein [Tanacetum coccineum]